MVPACSWRPSNDVNEFWQPHNTMCGNVITLVSMMYITTYIASIVGVHSFISAMQEPIQNWRYLNYQNVCKTLFLWASATLAPFCCLWYKHMVNVLHVHSYVVTIIIHVHSNKVIKYMCIVIFMKYMFIVTDTCTI